MMHFVTVSGDGAIRQTTAPRHAAVVVRLTCFVTQRRKWSGHVREFVFTSVMKTKHRLELKKPGHEPGF
jgi:hypothetical protein